MPDSVPSVTMLEILLPVVLLAVAAASLLTVASVMRSRAAVDVRLRAIEERLGAVASHLGIPEPDHAEVVALVGAGRPVEAIAAHRRRTGSSLLQAKQFVDDVARRSREDG